MREEAKTKQCENCLLCGVQQSGNYIQSNSLHGLLLILMPSSVKAANTNMLQ